MFLGGGVAATRSQEERPGGSAAAILGLALVGGGLPVGLIGGVSGAVIGDAASEDQWVAIYEGPIEKYRKETRKEFGGRRLANASCEV